eukprot:CAMPEP_0170176894 /NCGR_PEP_ID=MMETSP0040_2-20121228/9654_1 /TAXON_ID=641309 /ORGANISM="Lotharella oceanica, Strain CCMP622" /LENGTH=126 /DNA_ID=CAMNT_0010419347 /DNA_START=99 /DNA_END=479 /DNA_ORIENTATION=+
MPKTIKITYVNTSGDRVTVDGKAGQNLLQVARDHNIDLYGPCNGGGQSVDDYGEGPCCTECRVFIAKEFHDKVNPINGEEIEILDWCEDADENSRLACQVVLSEDCDGMTVALPVWDKESYWNKTD